MSRSIETLLVLSLLAGVELLALALLDIVREFLFVGLDTWVKPNSLDASSPKRTA